MKKYLKRIFTVLLTLLISLNNLGAAYAQGAEKSLETIKSSVQIAYSEKETTGKYTDETINLIKAELDRLGINTEPYSGDKEILIVNGSDSIIDTCGYGETHNIGHGWSYRVDRPSGGDAKPHVHGRVNGKNIDAVENVDGTPSHGQTLEGQGVPKKVRDEVKNYPRL